MRRSCACSILYQRGIYPPEAFKPQKQYGLSLMVTSDSGLTKYLTPVLQQMSGEALKPYRPPLLSLCKTARCQHAAHLWASPGLEDWC